ncbi:MAG: family 43 glycosylhydrolase [Tannerella sp.]|jgi:hypothetical protein|nr:family 43 glycosylhydrolase [Tannerella sp.]
MKKCMIFFLLLCMAPVSQAQDVMRLISEVNDRRQTSHPEPDNAFWHNAAYHTGNMAAYEVTGEERYRAYSERWADHNLWQGAKSENKSQWEYRYGETDEQALFGDGQTCLRTCIGAFYPGKIWKDNNGVHINAHGGGILYHEGKYYWFGEHKGERSNSAYVGVTCYSSDNLYNWAYEGVALPVEEDEHSDIVAGCIIERPKVIYNAKTGKFVMYFHLELKDKGYSAARTGVAVADKITGPYRYLKSARPNAGRYPADMTEAQTKATATPDDFKEWWTPEWYKAVGDGMFVRRDFAGGQMSRDMTLFVDDDDKAYHIYASEENLTLHIAELSDDYLNYTGKYIRIAPAGHNEAPAIFKKNGKYFMITSGCTGWDPNAARLFTAGNIRGPWTEHPNPCRGEDAGLTFHSQSTYILPVAGKKDAFIFMADRWTPDHPIDGRYVWLPVCFENGLPVLRWYDRWDLSAFDEHPNGADHISPKTTQ